ncbi:unnamed protein product [Sphagnum balticum]
MSSEKATCPPAIQHLNLSEVSAIADSLLSPNTDRAVQDIISSGSQAAAVKANEKDLPAVKAEAPADVDAASTSSSSSSVCSTSSSLTLSAAPAPSTASTDNDNFENLQKAVQILARAKQLDELKRYDDALKQYRLGVDMLLEELIVRQGTDQSRTYLREKCQRLHESHRSAQADHSDRECHKHDKENQSQANPSDERARLLQPIRR